MDNEENNNVVSFGQVKGGKKDDQELPSNDYIVTDMDNDEYRATGFLIFTPHHCAIMQDLGNGNGAVPTLVLPLVRVKAAELVSDHENGDEVE